MTFVRGFKLPLKRPIFLFCMGFISGLLGLMFLDTFNFLLNFNVVYNKCKLQSTQSNVYFSKFQDKNYKKLVLLGVMTASKYIDNRAYNVWKTWAKNFPGQVFFFVAENTKSNYANEMPLIYLKGVDDIYPPQKKSFSMMRWMYDNFLEDYEWFMRSDDDLYVKNEKLKTFLRSLDSSKAHMIGQAGLGKGGEYGQLSLGPKDNYCMGGPGIILSREALRLLGPHLEKCLTELITGHEDVELGRCVQKYVGIACTWNYEMQTLFHNNQTSGSSSNATITSDFSKVITLHPIKSPILMQKVHIYSQTILLNALRSKKLLLKQELYETLQKINLQISANIPTIIPLIRQPINSIDDMQHWDFISSKKIFFCANQINCPRHTIDGNMRAEINKIIKELFDKFNENARQRGRFLQFQNIQYGYVRLEPLHGVDYILDIVLWYKKFRSPHRTTISVRRHAYIQQTFGPLAAISDKNYTKRFYVNGNLNQSLITNADKTVHIITSLQGRAEIFQRFALNLRLILPFDEKQVKIVIVLYRSQNITENLLISETIAELSKTLPVRVIDMKENTFNRGQALETGASSVPSNSLLFFTDIDMLFSYETIERIRLNTILNVQAYFPIIFSQYSQKYWFQNLKQDLNYDKNYIYDSNHGYFRSFGFGIASIYKEDFVRVGGYNLSIQGWGFEDVDFFEKVIQSHLTVMRAPDPSLVHVSHPIQCDLNKMPLAQYQMCIGTKMASLASHNFLAQQIIPYL